MSDVLVKSRRTGASINPHHQCFKPCEGDETGARATQDLMNYGVCPLGEIIDGEHQQAEEAKEIYEKLKKDMAHINSIESASATGEHLLDHVMVRLRELNIFKVTESTEDMMRSQLRSSLAVDGGKTVKSVAEFLILSDMYAQLSKSGAVRRMATYWRRTCPVEAAAQTPKLIKAYYVVWPCVIFFFAFGFQSFMLHMATHFYIYYMDHGPQSRVEGGGQLLDLLGNYVGEQFAENPDTAGAVTEGAVQIPMKILDLSGVVPFMFCVFSFVLTAFHQKFNIGLWTKTYLVASSLAVLKGIFDVVTILPDSIGWETCKSRLGEEGLAQLRGFRFVKHGWGALWQAMYHEVVGGENGRRVRYCADMMISGHTYFAVLFALSAYKQVAFLTEYMDSQSWRRFCLRSAVGSVCFICIVTEVVLVAAARFHYTVDMLASIVLVLLLWDSSMLEQVAADWSEGFHWQSRSTYLPKLAPVFSTIRRATSNGGIRAEEVVPSQSSLTNLRVLRGTPAWIDPREITVPPSSPPNGDGGPRRIKRTGEEASALLPLMRRSR